MKRPLIIFGTGDIAQLAHYYFTTDSDYEVAAFTVDREFAATSSFCGLPVVPFDRIAEDFPPSGNDMFVALSYTQVNALRRDKYEVCKALGYRMASYTSSHATVLSRGQIGENCFILEKAVVQPFVRMGNNVTVWSGSHIGHHATIGDHVFIAPCVAISGGVKIGESCFIGIHATLRDHIRIGEKCVIGAGALLLDDAAPEGVHIGHHASRMPISSQNLSKI